MPGVTLHRRGSPGFVPEGGQNQNLRKQRVHGAPALRGVRVGMSTTFPDVDPNAEPKIMQQSAIRPNPIEKNPIWPMIPVIAGVVASLAWTGTLVWVAGMLFNLW